GVQHRRRGPPAGRCQRLPAQPGLLRRADLAELPGQGVRRRQALLGPQLPRRGLGTAAGADPTAVGRHRPPAARLGGHLPIDHRAAAVHQHRVQPAAGPPRRPPDPRRDEADRAQRPRGHPGEDVGERPMKWLAAILVLAAAGVARAQDEGAVVRVIAEEAEVRTGPGFAYRAVYTATRGETLKADARASRDYWFHVVLPDGTYGWIIGDQVLPLDVDSAAPQPPTW